MTQYILRRLLLVVPLLIGITIITFTIIGAIAFAAFLGLIELFGALGAVLRWRWTFWYVLVLRQPIDSGPFWLMRLNGVERS